MFASGEYSPFAFDSVVRIFPSSDARTGLVERPKLLHYLICMSHLSLSVGEKAPDFTLRSESGAIVNLYSELERAIVVLFFYVKAFTPVCTSEVCAFRDYAQEFEGLGAKLFGISSDRDESARKFAGRFRLPYPLLVDEGGKVRQEFGVPKLLGFFPGRSTYVIGTDRDILHVTHAGLQTDPHIMNPLELLRARRTA
jgi:peroxiredoxin Q/BCP